MAECTLILPWQLFDPHPALAIDRPVIFVEEGLVFGDPHVGIRFHQQRIVLQRAAMRTYAAALARRGYDVSYRDFVRGKTIAHHLQALREEGYGRLHLCEPVDYLLERRLKRFAEESGVAIELVDTPMFLSPRAALEEEFGGKKRPLMARFYEKQRKRMGVLVEDGGMPVGGSWSFDHENRKPMPKKGLKVPPDPSARPTTYIREAIDYTKRNFPEYYGDAGDFNYPVSHAAAERWFEDFLSERFQLFGDYEDSISIRERVLFHGVLTPMLNIGLLNPQKLVRRALEFAEEHETPLNCVEGFVRQIIGWREFMRGAYDYLGVECRNGNFWGFEDRPIPEAFYRGTTGIDPVDIVIRRVLDHGWCHHIERLMVLGNFMLLCGLHPRRVNDWFMELFVDAYDWVMVPNVFGMSQFADGGQFTTKPYISGSNYVRKMSDFPAGDWCRVWDGLFWSFIDTNREFFCRQHRLGMMVRQLDRMEPQKLAGHRSAATDFLGSLFDAE